MSTSFTPMTYPLAQHVITLKSYQIYETKHKFEDMWFYSD